LPVIVAPNDESELLAGSEAPAPRTVFVGIWPSVCNGRVSTEDANFVCRSVARGPGDEIHRAANTVAVHIGLKGFADLNRINDPSGNSCEFEFADAGVLGRHVKAVDGCIR